MVFIALSVSVNNHASLFQLNEKLCQLTGVQSNFTSAYHPQSNGLDERFNQTLQQQLLKFAANDKTNWDLYIDAILFSYRVSRQDSTKQSPFVLVYGRQARLPIEFDLGPQEEMEGGENEGATAMDTEDNEENLTFEASVSHMIEIRRKSLENIQVAQERQKKYFHAKHCKDKSKYSVGSLVLLLNSRKLSKKGLKMEPDWTGPYAIHEVMSKGTYRLCDPTDSSKVLPQIYNMSRLKLYFQQVCL